MPVAMATRAPTAATASATQNSHQVGPNTSASPPTRNATMMIVTAVQDTARPWNDGNDTGVPGTWETKGATSWPPAPAPATALAPLTRAAPAAPDPGAVADLPALAGPTWFVMRAAPLLPPVVVPIIVVRG